MRTRAFNSAFRFSIRVSGMVFVGSLIYIASYIVIDVAYTWVDPRVRLA